jgi:hypothetical protein
MTGPRFEAFLALIYTDPSARAAFLNDRQAEACRFNLSFEETDALMQIDRRQLESAARSFENKRAATERIKDARTIPSRIRRLLASVFDPGHVRSRNEHLPGRHSLPPRSK